jgi:hypothetical protein
MADSTVQYEETAIHLIHAMPGRVRLRVTGEDAKSTLEAVSQLLQQQVGVEQVVTNAQTKSITVAFDAEAIPLSIAMELLEGLGVDVSTPSQVDAGNPTQTAVSPMTATQDDPFAAWKSVAFWKQQGRTFIPIIAGLVVARGLNLLGWRAILAYILTSRTTRGLIDQLDTANPAVLSVPAVVNQIKTPKQDKKQPSQPVPPVVTAKQPIDSTIAYRLVHAIRGRVRFHISRLAEDSQYAKRLQKLIEAEPAVSSVRVNPTAASIVIAYNTDLMPDAPMQERLSELILQADEANTVTSTPPPPPPAPPSSGGTASTSTLKTNNGLPKTNDIKTPPQPTPETEIIQKEDAEEIIAESSSSEIPPKETGHHQPLKFSTIERENLLDPIEEISIETDLEKTELLTQKNIDVPSLMSELEPEIEPPPAAPILPARPDHSLCDQASLWYCITQTFRSTFQFLQRGKLPWDAMGAGFQEALLIRLRAIAALHSGHTPALDQS